MARTSRGCYERSCVIEEKKSAFRPKFTLTRGHTKYEDARAEEYRYRRRGDAMTTPVRADRRGRAWTSFLRQLRLVRCRVDGTAAVDDCDEGPDGPMAEFVTRILLEHYGDGRPVHADVVMDTVQYRLDREATAAWWRTDGGDANATDEDEDDDYDPPQNADNSIGGGRRPYCLWADRRVFRVFRRCLLRLVAAGRVRVLYDCGGGCGGYLENDDPAGRERPCRNGCDDRDPYSSAAADKFDKMFRVRRGPY